MWQWVLITIVLAGVAAGGGFLVLVARESRGPRVLCLMYHRFARRDEYGRVTGSERLYVVPEDVFEGQIAYLKNAGFAFVAPDDVRRFAAGELKLPDPSVLLTFDDGCLSVDRIARPILERHGARGTTFVTTDRESYIFSLQGDDRRLSDEELRAADGDAMRFESHTVSHRPLRGRPDDEIRRELVESKGELERVLGRTIGYLAIPGNWFDRRVMRIAREAGYRAVWCSNPGTTRVGADPFGLPRIGIEGTLSLPQFRAAISPSGIVRRRIVSGVRRLPGRLLGPRYWDPVSRWIRSWVPGGYISNRRLLAAGTVSAALIVLVLVWLTC